MAKHIRIEPDCPNCGKEMTLLSQGFAQTKDRPFGSYFEAWYSCSDCGFSTEHASGNYRHEAKSAAAMMAEEEYYND